MKDGPLNAPYLAFIRKQPCCVCGSRRGIEAAHTGPHALSRKSPDRDAIPLCRVHHQGGNDSLHALGPWRFAEYHRLNIPAIVRRLNRLGSRFLALAHRPGRMQRSPEFYRRHCMCGWKSGWFRSEAGARAALDQHLDRGEVAA